MPFISSTPTGSLTIKQIEDLLDRMSLQLPVDLNPGKIKLNSTPPPFSPSSVSYPKGSKTPSPSNSIGPTPAQKSNPNCSIILSPQSLSNAAGGRFISTRWGPTFGLPLELNFKINSFPNRGQDYKTSRKAVSAGYDTHDGIDMQALITKPDPSGDNWRQCVGSKGTNGAKIFSIADGTVIYAGVADGYGWLVGIEHPNPTSLNAKYFSSWYGHLPPNGIFVKEGDIVKRGQQIALMGNEGLSGGYHLHFEVYRSNTPFGFGRYSYPSSNSYNQTRIDQTYTTSNPVGIETLDPIDVIPIFADNGGPFKGSKFRINQVFTP